MSEAIEATIWVRRPPMIIRRTALEDSDPESWVSLWREKFNEEMPIEKRKEIGVSVPKKCPCCNSLIEERILTKES